MKRFQWSVATGLVLVALAFNQTAVAEIPQDAEAAFAKQDWKTAADLYASIVKDEPTGPNLWHLGRAYMGLGRYADAKSVLLQALDKAPKDPQAEFSLAITLDNLGDEDDAFKYLGLVAHAGVMPQTLETHPGLAHMRKDPRFAGLVETADRSIHVCKYDERYRAMDFWLGDWDGIMGNQKILAERITAEAEGCMLREEWDGVDGTHGRSEIFFNPKTKLWESVWVDAGGNVVKLSSEAFAKGSMQMTGENIDPDSTTHLMRQSWKLNADGTVTRSFDQSDDGGKTWQTMLMLQLKRVKADGKAR